MTFCVYCSTIITGCHLPIYCSLRGVKNMKKSNRIPEPESRLGYLRTDPDRYMTQEQVAAAIGCTPKTYRSWEKDGDLPNTTDLIALAKLFDVSTDYILGLSDYQKTEYKMISELTGLNEEAVKSLCPPKEDRYIEHEDVVTSLNMLLTSVNFRNMLSYLVEYSQKQKELQTLFAIREKQIQPIEEYKPNLSLLDLIDKTIEKKEIAEIHAQRNFGYIFDELRRKAEEKQD